MACLDTRMDMSHIMSGLLCLATHNIWPIFDLRHIMFSVCYGGLLLCGSGGVHRNALEIFYVHPLLHLYFIINRENLHSNVAEAVVFFSSNLKSSFQVRDDCHGECF